MAKHSTAAGLVAFTAFVSVVCPSPVHAADLSGYWWNKTRTEIAPVNHDKLPFTPEGAAEYKKNREAIAAKKDPLGQNPCILDGMPREMLTRLPIEILQQPRQITIIFEQKRTFRPIPLGKWLQPDPDPSYNGSSLGSWDGDTFVVDTTRFKPNTVIDKTGIPHSDAMHLTERLSLRDAGKTLRDEITVEDPKTFTKPWTFSVDFAKRADIRLMEDVCTFGPPERERHKAG